LGARDGNVPPLPSSRRGVGLPACALIRRQSISLEHIARRSVREHGSLCGLAFMGR
jgi:hypothetical protein